MLPSNKPQKIADLALEGGGVKGTALVGAAVALLDSGYTFSRVAGTSAGAFVGAFIAAGVPAPVMAQLTETMDLKSFADKTFLAKFGIPGEGASILANKGIYKGKNLRDWVYDVLKEYGVETFADLKLPLSVDPAHPERCYKFVCITSDITRQEMIELPGDYARVYGLDPDKQLVADAVAASAAIPLGFEPQHIRSAITGQVSTLVDGGITSSFPIDIFDTDNGVTPRWPTFGIRLEGETPATQIYPSPERNFVQYILALYNTACHGRDARIEAEPKVVGRSIFINTSWVNPNDFGISVAVRKKLYDEGYAAARKFITGFSFPAYLRQQRALRAASAAATSPGDNGLSVA